MVLCLSITIHTAIMLNVVMLVVTMQSVVMFAVFMLSVEPASVMEENQPQTEC